MYEWTELNWTECCGTTVSEWVTELADSLVLEQKKQHQHQLQP